MDDVVEVTIPVEARAAAALADAGTREMVGRLVSRVLDQVGQFGSSYLLLALTPLTGLLLSPMIAALAMSLSSVSVVGNALRLKRWRS